MTESKKQIRKFDDSKNSQQPKVNLVIRSAIVGTFLSNPRMACLFCRGIKT